jgi:DNA-binding MarR family transcriptional regulator
MASTTPPDTATTPTDTADCVTASVASDLPGWDHLETEAWIGLLETHKRLTRAVDGELEAEHGLSLSALEVLMRLALADDQGLGLSALAVSCGLSLSRISRIMDSLEARGLVERRAVASDARAVQGQLTEAGLELVRGAQATHVAAVQRVFFEHLEDEDVAALARIFSKLLPPGADVCTATEDSRS